MDLRMFNDFSVTEAIGGNHYHLDTDDGVADCVNFIFNRGFIINLLEYDTSSFINQNLIGEMNYLMINVDFFGREVLEIDGSIYPRRPGTVTIDHPLGSRITYHIPTRRYTGISIGYDLNGFRLIGCDDLPPTAEVIESIMVRYTVDSRLNFELGPRSEADLYALRMIMKDPKTMDEDLVHAIVSDLLRNMYLVDKADPVEIQGSPNRVIDDDLWERLMLDGMDSSSIQDICGELGVDKYSISRSFSKLYGHTPYAFHKRHRMMCAAAMIILGERRMNEVSAMAGYSNESKFAGSFKSLFGCRPKHFRILDGLY
ncbi:MAG: helix-turn-helix transcriptional regulator [Candidatus Methanomethylophilaceae archaeon]|nr:helix-turn-helix transcriptional regulator [Candidatus Methanomethylophilaceae archaeon]